LNVLDLGQFDPVAIWTETATHAIEGVTR